MPIIESHVHVWTLDAERYPWSSNTASPPTESATAEELLQTLDENGVSGAVLVQPIYYEWDNSYIADCLARYPDKFAGICLVDPEQPDAPDRYQYWSEEKGFCGVRLRPCHDRNSAWLSDPATFPLWERLRELNGTVIVLSHIEQLAMLATPAERFPEVPIVIDHMAWPPVDEGPEGGNLQHLLRLARFPNVYVKITAPWAIAREDEHPYRSAEPIFRRVFETFGPQHCMWGTDWPHVRHTCGYGRTLDLYRGEWDWISAADREWVLYGTITRVWPKPFAEG